MIVLGTDYLAKTEKYGSEPFETLRDVDRGTKIWMSRDLEPEVCTPATRQSRQTASVVELNGTWLWCGAELLALGEVGRSVSGYRLVFMDADPTLEAELNSWYDEEHLPGIVSVVGVQWAARYRAPTVSPQYLAVYGLDSLEVCESSEWRNVGDTDWSNRIRPAILNRYRSDYAVWNSAVVNEGE
jgi:hypothetical protein